MVEAKCKCGKSKMNFQNLELADIDGLWECESCFPAEEAKREAAKEKPKAEPKAEQPKQEEKKPQSRKRKESPKQDGEKQ